MTKDSLKIMDELRKQFIGREFSKEEFKQVTGTNDEGASILMDRMFMDCYLTPTERGNLQVVHGKERKDLIKRKKKICAGNVNKWYQLHKHLNGL